jgi:peroxidase
MNPLAQWFHRNAQMTTARPAGRRPATTRRQSLRFKPRVNALEDRCLLSVESIDGTGNNLTNPDWGSAGTDLIRMSPVGYADGISAPALPQDQSARAFSNILNNQADPNNPSQDINTVDQQSLSDFGYVFGQFMDHDMDLTPDGGASFPIAVAPGDPIGPNSLPFTRSQFDPSTGTSASNPRQQVNAVTSFLDLSQVYGSDEATADALRTHVGGQLKTSPGDLLPYDNATYFTAQQLAAINQSLGGMQNEGSLSTSNLFVTGDIRGNENLELTALQTLFVRNHNLIASELQKAHPDWSDEQLYQEARKINIAEYQSIIYNQWIPAVLGPNALPAYTGYNPNVNPSIANEFSTVAFRFGHSLLSGGIERHDNSGLDIADVNPNGASINLAQDFFDPNLLSANGDVVDSLTDHTPSNIDAVLKGDADGNSQAMDVMAINEVRDLLFGNAGAGGQDLIARDIQRARDNGLPDYNTMRVAYGLSPVTEFAQITSNVQVQKELRQAYGSVNNIDAFEGGLAEDHVPGSDVGPLFQAIMVDQFTRLRDGDRFFYLNESWSPDELKILQQGNTLANIIEANTGITNLQSDVFLFKASISGTVVSDHGGIGHPDSSFAGNGHQDFSAPGLAKVTVQLEDNSGDVLATTVTDSSGDYGFNQLNGLSGTGKSTVRIVVPSGHTQTSANPSMILISHGDIDVSGVNFVVA